jgi:hypothetical protein
MRPALALAPHEWALELASYRRPVEASVLAAAMPYRYRTNGSTPSATMSPVVHPRTGRSGAALLAFWLVPTRKANHSFMHCSYVLRSLHAMHGSIITRACSSSGGLSARAQS